MSRNRDQGTLNGPVPVVLGFALLVLLWLPQAALAEALPVGDSELVVALGPPQFPDGIAVDKRGNLYVSFFNGSAWKFGLDRIPEPVCELTFGGGIATHPTGDAYVIGVRLGAEVVIGVFRIPREGGPCEVLPDTGLATRPNALTFDKIGNLYVTDSTDGRIFKIKPGQGMEPWLDDPLLDPVPLPGNPQFIVGANGIQYWRGSLIVANTTQKTLLRVPVMSDGSAGVPTVLYGVAANPGGPVFFPDGIALDVHGDIYVADALSSQVVRVSADGMYAEIIAAAFAGDPLEGPTALAFGAGMGERKNLLVTNSGLIDPDATGSSSLIRLGAGIPGKPLP